MPAFIGSIKISNVSGGTIQFGDICRYSPTSSTRSVSGSGSGNSGAVIQTNNTPNRDITTDIGLLDEPPVE